MNTADWKCPVCGFYADNGNAQDKHIKETGHLTQGSTGDAGVSHPHADTSDMSYSEQVGYAPGASNQIDSIPKDKRQENEYKEQKHQK